MPKVVVKAEEAPVLTDEKGYLSNTLHFVSLLGLASKPSKRKVGEEYYRCPSTVGVRLHTDIAISVPEIHPLKDRFTGIKPEDVGSRAIKANKTFDLNMYELMYLIVRDEYAGYISRDSDPRGVYFSPKMRAFLSNKVKLPTPALIFKPGTGAIKADMLEVDFLNADGNWEIKPEFAKKFGPLLEEKPVNIHSSRSKIEIMALSLQHMLYSKESV